MSLIPAEAGVGNSTTLLYTEGAVANTLALATASSLPFDYVVRQKVGGTNMSTYFVKQFPVIPFDQIPVDLQWEITRRVAELTYFNHDLDGWAQELFDELTDEQKLELPQLGEQKPFIFDPDHRAVPTPKTSAAPAASTKPSASSKTTNSANTANTAPNAL